VTGGLDVVAVGSVREQARKAADVLRSRCRSAVVTIGAGGAVVAGDRGVELVPAEAVDAVDSTGAGDASTGALAAALSAGRDLVEAARIGVRAGTYAVTRPGAQASFASAADLGLGPLHRRG
jgi:ribokinase